MQLTRNFAEHSERKMHERISGPTKQGQTTYLESALKCINEEWLIYSKALDKNHYGV